VKTYKNYQREARERLIKLSHLLGGEVDGMVTYATKHPYKGKNQTEHVDHVLTILEFEVSVS
jgi:hypothetical protein